MIELMVTLPVLARSVTLPGVEAAAVVEVLRLKSPPSMLVLASNMMEPEVDGVEGGAEVAVFMSLVKVILPEELATTTVPPALPRDEVSILPKVKPLAEALDTNTGPDELLELDVTIWVGAADDGARVKLIPDVVPGAGGAMAGGGLGITGLKASVNITASMPKLGLLLGKKLNNPPVTIP